MRPEPEPKPKVFSASTSAYLIMLVVGLVVLLASTKLLPTESSSKGRAESPAAPLAKSPLQFTENEIRSFLSVLVPGIGLALITVSLFEVIKLWVQWFFYRLFQRRFDQLFGDGASSRAAEGQIFLQADRIGDLREPIPTSRDDDAPLESRQPAEAASLPRARGQDISTSESDIDSNYRAYKAREWLNRWDVEGARRLRDKFRELHFHAPILQPIKHGEQPLGIETAPFAISMGLGFTDKSTGWIEDLKWLRVRRDKDGDSVYLSDGIYPSEFGQLKRVQDRKLAAEIPEGGHSLTPFIPPDWSIDQWVREPHKSKDYAIILRRTCMRPGGRRQILFVLAGFTEKGTAAAGEYLAANWEELWKAYVKDSLRAGQDGDFLIFITGPSEYTSIKSWETVRRDEPITPELIAQLRDGEKIPGYKWERVTQP